jgi:CDP-6-deoxy-D-xylo-4-hexulose-3-dehydrase
VHDALDNTDKIMNDTFWIGVWPGLNEEMLSYVVSEIKKLVLK